MSDRPPADWKLDSKAGEAMRAGVLKQPEGAAVLKKKVRLGTLIDWIGKLVDEIKEIRSTNAKLLERVETLEDRPEMKYAGVWRQEQVYGAGTFATDGGSLWHAKRASIGERPGAPGGDAWQLAVKKGRDGRDAR
jgi:hypothetical protein